MSITSNMPGNFATSKCSYCITNQSRPSIGDESANKANAGAPETKTFRMCARHQNVQLQSNDKRDRDIVDLLGITLNKSSWFSCAHACNGSGHIAKNTLTLEGGRVTSICIQWFPRSPAPHDSARCPAPWSCANSSCDKSGVARASGQTNPGPPPCQTSNTQ